MKLSEKLPRKLKLTKKITAKGVRNVKDPGSYVSGYNDGRLIQQFENQPTYSAALKRIERLEEEVRLDNKEMIRDAYAIRELKQYDLRRHIDWLRWKIPKGRSCLHMFNQTTYCHWWSRDGCELTGKPLVGQVIKGPDCPNKKGEGDG